MIICRRITFMLGSCLLALVGTLSAGRPALAADAETFNSSGSTAIVGGSQCGPTNLLPGGSLCEFVAVFGAQNVALHRGRIAATEVNYSYSASYQDSDGNFRFDLFTSVSGNTAVDGGNAVYKSAGLTSASIVGTVNVQTRDINSNIVGSGTVTLSLAFTGTGPTMRANNTFTQTTTGPSGSVNVSSTGFSFRQATAQGGTGLYSGPFFLAQLTNGRNLNTTITRP
jgi:hypothetical protein